MPESSSTDLPSAPPSPVRARLAPIGRAERIDSIDVLRGVAVLGILLMNIQSFSMIGAAYFNPTAYGDLTGVNWWVWVLCHIFADQKFMTIFSMLFGAGLVVSGERAARTHRSWVLSHYRRMFALLLIGAGHAFFIWDGDILFLYALCGMVVVWCRRWRPTVLLIVGMLVVSVASGIALYRGVMAPSWPEQDLDDIYDWLQPSDEMIDWELWTYQGPWTRQNDNRFVVARHSLTWLNLEWGIWRAGGLMLVGMALFKWGVFSAARSRQFYLNLVNAAVFLGVPLIVFGVVQYVRHDFDPLYILYFGIQFNYWGSVLVSLGHVAVVMMLCQAAAGSLPLRLLANVGRMALTNYLLESIICTFIFYGHGLGWIGQVSRLNQLRICVAVWLILIALSNLWLAKFRYGPFEWIWRCVTYWKWQPLRLHSA
jgi:uncharacterized protein